MPAALRVRVRLENWAQFEELHTRDISRGGAFLRLTAPPAPGTRLDLVIRAPDGREVSLPAEVAHVVSPERAAATGATPGVGVRFLDLGDSERAAVDALLDRARAVAAEGSNRAAAIAAEPVDVIAALREELGELKEKDDFEVLGLPHDATSRDVERAYLMQVKRWHPKQYRDEPQAVRELVAEIFIRIQRARDTLARETARAELRRRNAERDRKRQAERAFASAAADAAVPHAEARRLLAAGRWDEAARHLSAALRDDPADAAAREWRAIALARAALAGGDVAAAAIHLEEAIRVNPSSGEAIRLLRGLRDVRRRTRREVLARLVRGRSIDG